MRIVLRFHVSRGRGCSGNRSRGGALKSRDSALFSPGVEYERHRISWPYRPAAVLEVDDADRLDRCACSRFDRGLALVSRAPVARPIGLIGSTPEHQRAGALRRICVSGVASEAGTP